MELDKITLNNIRSYDEETVTFPDGITLLSGDIGSGKTSILLAVEFALFGFIRGSFSGSSLLQHGSDTGSVTLSFCVDGEKVTTHRVLNRTSQGIRQGTGWYEVDGSREEATAREIKAKVIEVLGYPASLVTKSKSMLYRYTVYTPQEEMKEIVRESADDRLEKIRKVLRLDKYRRVKDNVETYARDLRRSIKADERSLADEDELLDRVEELEGRLESLDERQESLTERKEAADNAVDDVEEELEACEDERESLSELERQFESTKSKLETLRSDLEESKKSLEKKKQKVDEDLEKPSFDLPDEETVEKKQAKVEEAITTLRDKRNRLQSKIGVMQTKIDEARELRERIDSLETCPTCGQAVGDEHKQTVKTEQASIIEEEEERRSEYEQQLSNVEKKLGSFNEKKEGLEATYKDVLQAKKKRRVYEEKKERNEERREEIQDLKDAVDEKESTVEALREEKERLENEKEGYEDLKEKVQALHDEKDDLQQERQTISSELATCKERRRNTEERLEEVSEELDDYQEAKLDIQRRRTTHTWLTEHFTNLLDVIEQHVLLTVHQRFDESFRAFFNDLIEDEDILVDIDNEFSPRVTQQGYEMEIDDLSGGEKTSVALAYRLAMNDVINDYMHEVKTNDLLVLDEPTDGFSGEQLDRLRDILKSLNASQVILVSHEEKLEGVTEHLIEVRKANNKSETTA